MDLCVSIDTLHVLIQSHNESALSCILSIKKQDRFIFLYICISMFCLLCNFVLFFSSSVAAAYLLVKKPLPVLELPVPVSLFLHQSSPEGTSIVPLSHHIHMGTQTHQKPSGWSWNRQPLPPFPPLPSPAPLTLPSVSEGRYREAGKGE